MFDEKFWLAIAFFTFLTLIIRKVVPLINKQLEDNSKEIAEEILAAKEAKERAEKFLVESEKRYQEALIKADQLIKDSEVEAKKYLEESIKIADAEIAKKMNAIEGRIKQEQERAVREIKTKIIDSAVVMMQNNLQFLSKSQSEGLARKAVDNVSKMVH